MTLNIADIKLENPFVLAPMAGVNCTSHRLLCREYGASLVYTQMYHCEFILHKLNNEGKQAVFDFVNIEENERPVAIQLVGNSPEKMAKAAKVIQDIANIIDINFGCCDPGMLKASCGGYFAKDLENMQSVAKAVVNAVNKPVTAKIRIGWDAQNINGVLAAQMLENSGIKAVAVHGRTVKQKYGGKANWQIIKQIKDKLSIPVIGNGDVRNAQKATEMLNKTGCDIVMIGRRTKGDPTFFRRILRKYEQKEKDTPRPGQVFKEFLKYYKQLDNNKSFTELKAHAMWFGKRANIGPRKREKIAFSNNVQEIEAVFFS
ncbi:MAG: tRNA dihydrouridine synthase [Nanoarchaeota archaeon]